MSRPLTRLLRDPGLAALNAAMAMASPVLLWRKLGRRKRLGWSWELDVARWTCRPLHGEAFPATSDETRRTRVAFVMLGTGEALMAGRLADGLRAARPGTRILCTVRDREATEVAARIADDGLVLPMPFDCALPTARWLDVARPDVIVLFEKFWFTNLVRGAALCGARVVVLNGHGRARKARYRWRDFYKRWQLSAVWALSVSFEEGRERLQPLLSPQTRLVLTGSPKFPTASPRLAPDREAALQTWLRRGTNGVPLFVAGSTHEGEEAFVLDAFAELRKSAPCVLLIAPRDVGRGDKVAELARSRGWKVSRRSEGSGAEPCDVLVLDTLGELGVAYGAGWGAFVGGTLHANGHNVAEPLVWGVPVAYGPRRGNFDGEQRACEAAGVGFRVGSAEELAAHWRDVLNSPELREHFKARALRLVDEQKDAFAQTLQLLLDAVDACA